MHEEFELKLKLSPEQLDALPKSPFLRSLIRRSGNSTRLVSTYFDTPDGLLRERAMALRVRKSGRARTQTQTLKVKANGESGAQHFEEYEAAVSGDRPDLEQIGDPDLKAMFQDPGLADAIKPVFTTEIARRKFIVRLFESEIELALDKGAIKAGKRSLPVCEAELELVSGRPARLYELALALQDSVPFGLEFRTKAGRGHALATDAVPEVVLGRKPALNGDMTAAQALGAIARACRDQIQGNVPVVLRGAGPDGDIEGVHQMRVGVRRLRVALRVFRAIIDPEAVAYLKVALKWLQNELGPARDWDVFLTETLPPIREAVPEEAGFEALASAAVAARDRGYERAHAALGDPRFVELMLRLNLWLEEGSLLATSGLSHENAAGRDPGAAPVTDLARRLLRRDGNKLRRIGRKYETLDTEALHQFRIDAKKLRYAIEFFRSLYPERAVKKTLRDMVAIQDILGAMNDSAVCQALLKDLQVRAALTPGYDKPLTERALGIVIGWQAAALTHRMQNLAAVWRRFNKSVPFWT